MTANTLTRLDVHSVDITEQEMKVKADSSLNRLRWSVIAWALVAHLFLVCLCPTASSVKIELMPPTEVSVHLHSCLGADLWQFGLQQFRSPYRYHCTRKTTSFLQAWPQKTPLRGWWGVPLPRGTRTVGLAPSTPLEAFWAIQALSATVNTGEQAFFFPWVVLKKKSMLFSPWTYWMWF